MNTRETTLPAGWTAYENREYGFSLAYPNNLELRSRPGEDQETVYLGLPVKFFASLRDTARGKEPENIAYFYAAENVTLEQFQGALAASNAPNTTIKETTDVSQGGLAMKKVVSTTAMEIDKIHYLFWQDSTLIIFSQFLQEEEAFAKVFQTLQHLSSQGDD